MAVLKYLVEEVILDIGEDIIKLAMRDDKRQRFQPSVEQMVETIFYKTSFRDLSLMNGVQIQISTERCNITSTNNEGVFIEIPEAELGNRKIVSAISIIGNQQPYDSTPLERKTPKDLPTPEGSTRIDVVGHNKIFVYTDEVGGMSSIKLFPHTITLNVGYAERLNEISQATLPYLSEFVTLGVKRYLFTQLRVSSGMAHIYHGHELPIIQDYLSEFREASDRYKELRKGNMKATLFANDTIQMTDYIDSIVR